MSDYLKKNNDSEIDDILAQVRNMNSSAGDDAPSKTWSLDDVDRLIAKANGEEYVPVVKKELTPAEDFERILSREFDTGIFTLQPIEGAKEETEMQDISSTSGETEVDGQETFFNGEEEDFFDESLFEIETVIVPEDKPEPTGLRFAWQEQPAEEPEPEEEKAPAEIKEFYEGETEASEFFEKKEEKIDETKIIDYKTRFFTTLKLENTVEIDPVGPVDRSGLIVQKSAEKADNGLDAMPKIISAETAKEMDDEKTRIMEAVGKAEQKMSEAGNDVEGQIMLTGFEEIPAETLPEQSSEGDVEEKLSEMRKQKAKNFKLVNAVELDEDFKGEFEAPPEERARQEKIIRKQQQKQEKSAEKPVSKEYITPSERASVHSMLTERNQKATLGLVTVAILGFVLIILNIIPAAVDALAIETEIFAAGSTAMGVMNAILVIAAIAINSNRFTEGIAGIFKKNVTGETAISLVLIVALFQNMLAAVFGGGEAGSTVFSLAAVGSVLISRITEKLDAKRMLSNFEVCTYKYEHNMYAVHPLENESEIFELGRGLLMGNADLLYSSKVDFPTDFIKNSQSEAADKKTATVLIPVAAGISFIAAIVSGIIEKDVMAAFSAYAGTFCVCSPIFISLIPALISYISNRNLNATGTMISSLNAAEETAASNAVIIDSADIFDRSRCTMHGMKDFKNIRIDDVLLYAAALVIKSGGPLRDSFEQVVDGRQDLLPSVKELVYEDKLGVSARIHGQKVLLGNRNLLVNHSVEVPEKAVEERYSHNGRKVMYLAVAGKIAALFVVSYAVDSSLAPYFRALESNGIQVLVRTNDANVTEELVSKSFGLPKQNFKILSSVAGKLFKRRRDAVCDKLPAKIVHDGTAFSMLRAVAAACNMSSQKKFGSVMQIIITALAFVFSMVIYITSILAPFNGFIAAAFLIFWFAVTVLMMIARKIK